MIMRQSLKHLSMVVVTFATTVSPAACIVGGDSAEQQEAEKPDIGLVASVKDDATDVSVVDSVSVQVKEGHHPDKVVMTNPEGKGVKDKLDSSGTKWTTAEPLGYSKTYEISATSSIEKLATSFTTVEPTSQVNGYLSSLDSPTVGIGQTIAVRFSASISDRKATEEAIKVTTEPKAEGAFYWLNSSEVRWRPEEYWKPGTKVTVKSDTYGTDLDDDMYGAESAEASFTIGDEVIAITDDATKTMVIRKSGEIVNSMPISMGSNAHPTPDGQYIIGNRNETTVMDSRTYGLPLENSGYVMPVNYATQMSYSGIYAHGAPWSTWAQGSVNQSHGCINVIDANAKWFLDNTKCGDIVIVRNTISETLSGADGLGDWNIPWETWKKGNADETSS